MSLIDELADMFPDTILVERLISESMSGDKEYDAPIPVPARVTKGVQSVRDIAGEEKASTVTATLAGVFNVKVGDRYTLPARFEPRQPEAIQVLQTTDEDGPHHETVMF